MTGGTAHRDSSAAIAACGRDIDWDEAFTSAALRPECWHDTLAQLARATGSAHGQLIGIGGTRAAELNVISDFDPALIEQGPALGIYDPGASSRIVAAQTAERANRPDAIVHEIDYAAARPLLTSDVYLEFCERADIPHGCQTNLVVDGDGLIGLATLRSYRDGPTTADQRAIFARASEAARRGVRLQERLAGEQARLMAGHFELIGLAAFILGDRGETIAMTAAAEALLSGGRVRLRHGRIEAAGTPLSLRDATDALVRDDGAPHIRLRLDTAPCATPSLFLEGFRLPRTPWGVGQTPRAIVIAGPARRDRAQIARFLTAAYRLSPTEIDIALRLHTGESRASIAGGRSIETLRTHLKSIYAKTGVEGEAALMRVIAGVVA